LKAVKKWIDKEWFIAIILQLKTIGDLSVLSFHCVSFSQPEEQSRENLEKLLKKTFHKHTFFIVIL